MKISNSVETLLWTSIFGSCQVIHKKALVRIEASDPSVPSSHGKRLGQLWPGLHRRRSRVDANRAVSKIFKLCFTHLLHSPELLSLVLCLLLPFSFPYTHFFSAAFALAMLLWVAEPLLRLCYFKAFSSSLFDEQRYYKTPPEFQTWFHSTQSVNWLKRKLSRAQTE